MGVLLSVIVPCYNVEPYLKRCVDSILNQTLGQDKIEIILVDDCSTDGTRELIHEYDEKYSCIKALYNSKNLRQGGARNRGMNIAIGKYLGFVDSDDWIEPFMYEDMTSKAEEYDCDIVNILSVRSSKEGFLKEEETESGEKDSIITINSDDERRDMIAGGQVKIGAWNCVFKRDFVESNQLRFPEHLVYEDVFWGCICHLYYKKIYQIKKYYYHYFVRSDSTVLIQDNKSHFDFFTMQKLLWNEYKKRNALDEFGVALEFDYLMNFAIIGLKIFSLRFVKFPVEQFFQLQKDLKHRIPDWYDNPYIETNTTDFQKMQLSLLNRKLTREEALQFGRITRDYYQIYE